MLEIYMGWHWCLYWPLLLFWCGLFMSSTAMKNLCEDDLDKFETHAGEITLVGGIIYDDTPRPKWWKHPIKWWKWEQSIIGYFELDDPIDPENSLTVTFGEPD